MEIQGESSSVDFVILGFTLIKKKNIKTCRKSRAPIKNKIKIEKEGAQVEEKRQKMFSTVVPIYLKSLEQHNICFV